MIHLMIQGRWYIWWYRGDDTFDDTGGAQSSFSSNIHANHGWWDFWQIRGILEIRRESVIISSWRRRVQWLPWSLTDRSWILFGPQLIKSINANLHQITLKYQTLHNITYQKTLTYQIKYQILNNIWKALMQISIK